MSEGSDDATNRLGLYSLGFSSQLRAREAGVTLYVQLELSGAEVEAKDKTPLFDHIKNALDLQAILAVTPSGSTDSTTYRGLAVQNADKTLTTACLLALSGLPEDAAERVVEAIARQFLPAAFAAFVEAGYFKLTSSCLDGDVEKIYNSTTQQFDW